MAGKYNLDKPNPLWKHMPKWIVKDSDKIIWNLHQIEKEERTIIAVSQVKMMPNGLLEKKLKAQHLKPARTFQSAEILALYPGGKK